MSEMQGTQGTGMDIPHPYPESTGWAALKRPRVSVAVTFHLRTHSAGTSAQKAREKAAAIPAKADNVRNSCQS